MNECPQTCTVVNEYQCAPFSLCVLLQLDEEDDSETDWKLSCSETSCLS